MRFAFAVSLACLLAVAAGSAQGAIVHQYLFNSATTTDTTVADEKGGSAAVLAGGAVLDGLGKANLTGGAPGALHPYVNLPGNVLPTTNGFSFEIFATLRTFPGYNYLLDSGTTTGGANPTPGTGYTGQDIEFGYQGGGTISYWSPSHGTDTSVALPQDQMFHLVLTYAANGDANVYLNGAAVHNLTLDALSSFTFNMAWLGRSGYDSDPYMNGTIDQVTIYDTVLSSTEVGNLAATPIPEPATMALLGLGAVGLLRRRRA